MEDADDAQPVHGGVGAADVRRERDLVARLDADRLRERCAEHARAPLARAQRAPRDHRGVQRRLAARRAEDRDIRGDRGNVEIAPDARVHRAHAGDPADGADDVGRDERGAPRDEALHREIGEIARARLDLCAERVAEEQHRAEEPDDEREAGRHRCAPAAPPRERAERVADERELALHGAPRPPRRTSKRVRSVPR